MNVAVLMGSANDKAKMAPALETLAGFGVTATEHVMSAHRTPTVVAEFARSAKDNGYGVIICAVHRQFFHRKARRLKLEKEPFRPARGYLHVQRLAIITTARRGAASRRAGAMAKKAASVCCERAPLLHEPF